MNLPLSVYERAKVQPDEIAYEFMDERYTYAQFEQSIAQFSGALKHLGVKKGDHIALLVGNTPHFLITLYASWRLEAVVVPINPTYTAREIAYIVQNSDAKVIVALDQLFPMFEAKEQLFPNVQTIIACETNESAVNKCMQLHDAPLLFQSVMQLGNPLNVLNELDKDESAIILYTSGTSGTPKGAMLTHENVYSNARDVGAYLKMSSEDRIVATLPVFHVFALTVVVNAPLCQGATILLVPEFSPKKVFKLIQERQATVFAGVPTMYNFLYQYDKGKKEDYESIRLSISGGSALPVTLLHNFEEKFNTRISEGYGLSEASPVTCFNPIDRERIPGSIGPSIVNVENKVVDEHGNEVPKGKDGELIVRGPNVMKGYYKMPEETKEALKDGWLYTGDMATEDENGYFYIVDRKSDMITVGGYNVYPREIEEVLYKHPDVVECAAVGIPDDNFGEAVHAHIVLRKDSNIDEPTIINFCLEHLAKYKVPTDVYFVDELPKNATGKILRRALTTQ